MFGRRRIDFPLAGTDLFAGATDRELRKAQMLLSPVTVSAGHVLVRQGTRGAELLIVADGHVSVTVDRGDGPEPLAVLGPVDVLGELSLVYGMPHVATAVTLTEATVYAATPPEAFALFHEVPAFSAHVHEIAEQRSRLNVARWLATPVPVA